MLARSHTSVVSLPLPNVGRLQAANAAVPFAPTCQVPEGLDMNRTAAIIAA